MSRLEVLVATMHQKDFSLFGKMNIQTDVIFCNQCDKNEFLETEINGCRVRMLSTTTRGVGINRNLAMQLSNAEICLCADDDIVYENGYENIICSAFDKLVKADLIAFNLTNFQNSKNLVNKTKRVFIKNYGTICLAYRNSSAQKFNVSFSRLFGGGAIYSCGEDTLFCIDFKKRGKLYACENTIGRIQQNESTWFKGYTDKFFYDKGVLLKTAYPHFWRIVKYYLIFIFYKKQKDISLFKMIKLMNSGAKEIKKISMAVK